MHIKLSTLAMLLGLGVLLPNLYGLAQPERFAANARKFPRSLPWGIALMALGTIWFIWNVKLERIADFESMKNYLFLLFAAVGLGSCIVLRDFLAVRGLAVVALLLAKLMVDTARWADSPWRLVIITWAYVLVIAGMWFTVSPWRMRDLLNWATATPERVMVGSALRAAFGGLVFALGLFVF